MCNNLISYPTEQFSKLTSVREILLHRPYEGCKNSNADIEEVFSQPWQILCFELKTVEKYGVLEREFSKRLETKAIWKKR